MSVPSITRRGALVGLAALASSRAFAGSATIAAPYGGLPQGAAPAPSGAVPVLTPSDSWTGYQSATILGNGGSYTPNTQLFVNGVATNPASAPASAWRYPAVVNLAEPEGMIIDPANNKLVAMAYSGDPSGAGMKEIEIRHMDRSIVIPGSAFKIGNRNVPGWEFALAQLAAPSPQAAMCGFVDLFIIGRPMNGFEKAIKRTVFIDHFGASGRSNPANIAKVAPNGYIGATATTWADALTGKPFATINKACAAATLAAAGPAPIIKLLAGTHLQDDSPSTTNPAPFLVTVQADDGLTKAQVIIDKSPGSSLPYSAKTGSVGLYSRHTLFKGVTQKWTNTVSWRINVPNVATRTAYWQSSTLLDDNNGYGPVIDVENAGIGGWSGVDPDEDGTTATGHGGYGFFFRGQGQALTDGLPLNDPADTVFYTNDGSKFGFMEIDGNVISTKVDAFSRNVNLTIGYDAKYLGVRTDLKRVSVEGYPALDYEDACYVNVQYNLRCQTPFKQRFHDACTLGIVSRQVVATGSGAATFIDRSGAAKSVASSNGWTIVTWDPNSLGGQPAVFIPTTRTDGDIVTRFMKGPMVGTEDSSIGYGWQTCTIGYALDVTIGGTVYSLTQYQSLVKGALTAAGPGDRATVTGKAHTDSIQLVGAGDFSLPTYNNMMWWNFNVFGPGLGNMFLLTTNASDTWTIQVDAAGNFVVPSVPSCRVATTAAISLTAAPATIDGVTLAVGDRVLIKNQASIPSADHGTYVFNGAGNPLTRTADAFTSKIATLITEGATNAATLWNLSTTGAITVGTTSMAFTRSTFQMFDGITLQMPSSTIRENAFILSINADGVSGKLSRPFLDPTDGVTPVAIPAGTACIRSKPLANSALVNAGFASGNFGQFAGGTFNAHFAYCAFDIGVQIKSYETLYAAEAVTIRGTAVGSFGLSNTGTTVQKSFFLADIASKGPVTVPASVSVADATSAVSDPAVVIDATGRIASGTARRLASPVTVPFDINGKVRAIGSWVGPTAQSA